MAIPLGRPRAKCTKLEGEAAEMGALPFRLESLKSESLTRANHKDDSDCVPNTR